MLDLKSWERLKVFAFLRRWAVPRLQTERSSKRQSFNSFIHTTTRLSCLIPGVPKKIGIFLYRSYFSADSQNSWFAVWRNYRTSFRPNLNKIGQKVWMWQPKWQGVVSPVGRVLDFCVFLRSCPQKLCLWLTIVIERFRVDYYMSLWWTGNSMKLFRALGNQVFSQGSGSNWIISALNELRLSFHQALHNLTQHLYFFIKLVQIWKEPSWIHSWSNGRRFF